MSQVHPVRQLAREAHHRVLDTRYWLTGTQTRSVSVEGHTAQFLVDNHKEHWRATDLMGEKEIIGRFISEMRPKDTVWDIGACVGTYSLFAAAKADAVHAFEPVPSNARRLRQHAALNDARDTMTTWAIALSNHTGQVSLDMGPSLIGEGTHQVASDGNFEVGCFAGDEIAAPQPDAIKIDVEGHELAVLDGLEATLATVERVLVEVHLGVDTAAVRRRLREAGLSVGELDLPRNETYIVARRE